MSLLERQEDICINLKNKLDELVGFVSDDLTPRQKIYLESINKLIEKIEINIDDFVLDVNSSREITSTILEEMKDYIIDERVKEKFMPYMLIYRMYLEKYYN
tara:strand:- start:191 stop:496 length:306 start_codon:yes stop_codon:yes gene_type:complete